MSFVSDVKRSFQEGSMLTKLIFVNLGVFVVVKLLMVIFTLCAIPTDWLYWLTMTSNVSAWLHKPWTVLTYMFLHVDFVHILFNVLTLYWFGQIFLMFYSQRDLVGVYLIGGLSGAAFYALIFNVFPYFNGFVEWSQLLGASASVMAIVLAAATYSPDYRLRLFLVGSVKLSWLAIAYVLISILSLADSNGGGECAHIGGALAGFVFAVLYKKGTNITAWIGKIIDWIVDLFKKITTRQPKMKVSYENKNYKEPDPKRETDMEYNIRKKQESDNIDRILDKVKQSGYDSLSEDERRTLFGRK